MSSRKTLFVWAVLGLLGVEAGLCKPTRTTSNSISTTTAQSETIVSSPSTTATTSASISLTSTTAEACQTISNPGFDVNGGEGWTASSGQVNFIDLGPVAHSPPGVAELIVSQLGASAGSGISQKLTSHCLTPGEAYFLDFYFRASQQESLDDCRVETNIDGVAQQWGFTQQPPLNQDANGWTQFEGLFFAPSNEPTIGVKVWCNAFDAIGSNQVKINVDDFSIRWADLSV